VGEERYGKPAEVVKPLGVGKKGICTIGGKNDGMKFRFVTEEEKENS
jgi:hypothetical protein